VLTNIAFFILFSVTPYTSHTSFIMNQKWFGSSFPTSLTTSNFIVLTILTRSGHKGGVGEDGGEYGEAGSGVGGGGMHRILYLIKLIKFLGETLTSSSLPPRRGKIKGLVYVSTLPSFL